jgi:orotate phosphoribosyltransferase
LVVEDVLVVIDRSDGPAAALAAAGLRLHSVLTVRALVDALRELGAVPAADLDRALEFVAGGR